MWTDRDTAIAMSAAPSSSMTSVHARYEKPAPPMDVGKGAAVSPSAPIPAKSRPVVAFCFVALDRAGCDLALRELARCRLEQPLLLAEDGADSGDHQPFSLG